MSFSWSFLWDILPGLLRGARFTVIATLSGFVLGLLGGLLLAVARALRVPILGLVAGAYVELIRNTPFLVQLFFVFYVLPEVGLEAPPLATGIIALGLNYSAYTAEVYRAGLESVPAGQWEAATSLNLPRRRLWLGVVLPQAIRPSIPVLGNYLIGMFKETPLLATITVIELFGAAQDVANVNFRYLEPYTAVALIFLALSVPSSILISKAEQRWSMHEHA